jgi:hypothetical protein
VRAKVEDNIVLEFVVGDGEEAELLNGGAELDMEGDIDLDINEAGWQ